MPGVTLYGPPYGGTNVAELYRQLLGMIVDHINDTVAAHTASAISFAPTGTVAATNVQAAIAEVAAEA